ncbi:hypothetical protein M0805_006397 [Coniferiporia weirii]|nr:hypothetical protein M0805_006397 [Coniferiporia weirii]
MRKSSFVLFYGVLTRSRPSFSPVRVPSVLYQLRTVATAPEHDQRKRLTTELKAAMKSRDTFVSTVLRSVLAEVYSADKNPSGPISSSQITSILRKAITRREDSATQFVGALRPELAESEQREAKFLATLLPPPMSEAEMDSILQELAADQSITSVHRSDPKRASGLLLKAFFARVDKSIVDGKTVSQRVRTALEAVEQKQ